MFKNVDDYKAFVDRIAPELTRRNAPAADVAFREWLLNPYVSADILAQQEYLFFKDNVLRFRPTEELEKRLGAVQSMFREVQAEITARRYAPLECRIENIEDPFFGGDRIQQAVKRIQEAVKIWEEYKKEKKTAQQYEVVRSFDNGAELRRILHPDEGILVGFAADNCLKNFLLYPFRCLDVTSAYLRHRAYVGAIKTGDLYYYINAKGKVDGVIRTHPIMGANEIIEIGGFKNQGLPVACANDLADYFMREKEMAIGAKFSPYLGFIASGQILLHIRDDGALADLLDMRPKVDVSFLPITNQDLECLAGCRLDSLDVSGCVEVTQLPTTLDVDRIIYKRTMGGDGSVAQCYVISVEGFNALHAQPPKTVARVKRRRAGSTPS